MSRQVFANCYGERSPAPDSNNFAHTEILNVGDAFTTEWQTLPNLLNLAQVVKASTAGTLKNFRLWFPVAPGAGNAWTFTIYKDSLPTNLTVTVADTATSGEDLTNSVNLAVGEEALIRIEVIGTPDVSATDGPKWSLDYYSDDNTETLQGHFQSELNSSYVADPQYLSGVHGAYFAHSADVIPMLIPVSCTIKKFYAETQQITQKQKRQFWFRHNQQDTDLGLTIESPDRTGLATRDVVCADGDYIGVKARLDGNIAKTYHNSFNFHCIAFHCENLTAPNYHQVIPNGGDVIGLSTEYFPTIMPFGENNVWRITSSADICAADGVIRNLRVKISLAPGSGDTRIFTLMKNGVATNLSVTLSEGETEKENTADIIPVVRGDVVDLRHSKTGNPDNAYVWHSIIFDSLDNGRSSIFAGKGAIETSDGTGRFFLPLVGYDDDAAPEADEGAYSIIIPYKGRIRYLYIKTSVLGTYTIRKNGVDTDLSCTLSSGTDANNITDIIDVIAGDKISLAMDITSSYTNTIRIGWCFQSLEDKQFPLFFRTYDASFWAHHKNQEDQDIWMNWYAGCDSSVGDGRTGGSDSNEIYLMTHQMRIKSMRVLMDENLDGKCDIDLTFRKNADTDTDITATVGGETFSGADLVNTAALVAGDRISIRADFNDSTYWSFYFNYFNYVIDMATAGQFIMAMTVAASLQTTDYLPVCGFLIGWSSSRTNTNMRQLCNACTFNNMYVWLSVAPGVGDSLTFTLRVNGVKSALTVAISGDTATTGNITADVSISNDDQIDIILESVGSPTDPYVAISFLVTETSEAAASSKPINFYDKAAPNEAISFLERASPNEAINFYDRVA